MIYCPTKQHITFIFFIGSLNSEPFIPDVLKPNYNIIPHKSIKLSAFRSPFSRAFVVKLSSLENTRPLHPGDRCFIRPIRSTNGHAFRIISLKINQNFQTMLNTTILRCKDNYTCAECVFFFTSIRRYCRTIR